MGYRLFKFVGRHRWGTLATIAAGVLLIGGFVLALRQSALERARTARAEEALDAVCGMLDSSDAGPEGALVAARERCARERTKVTRETIRNVLDQPRQ